MLFLRHSFKTSLARPTSLALATLTILSFINSRPSQAISVNLGFESGDFTGWATIGDAAVLTDGNPPEGIYQAGLTAYNVGFYIPVCTLNVPCDRRVLSFTDPRENRQAVRLDSLQASLNRFAVPNLNTVGLGTPFLGSAIATVIALEQREAIEFKWNFLTDDNLNSDFAFVSISRLDTRENLLFQPLASAKGNTSLFPSQRKLFDPPRKSIRVCDPSCIYDSTSGFDKETGFQNFRFVPNFLPRLTPVSVVFGVVNVNNGKGTSALLVDSVKAPEPASILGLLAFGALGAGSAIIRKKKQESTEKQTV